MKCGKRCLRGRTCGNPVGLSMMTVLKTVEYIWVNIWCMLDEDFVTQIALAKSQSMRRASHLPAYLGSCLTISRMCLPCLPR